MLLRACSLEDLARKGQVVVKGDDRPIVVFHNRGAPMAVDNRCPHMGFPLSRGSCDNGIITCHWHHARFDAASGCTFDPFTGDVDSYAVEVRDGEVWVSSSPQSRDAKAQALRQLGAGMDRAIDLDLAKAILTLRAQGSDDLEILREGLLYAAANRDEPSGGLVLLAGAANMRNDLHDETRFHALHQGLGLIARQCLGQPARRQRWPLESSPPPSQLCDWFRDWTRLHHREAAERTLLTAIARHPQPAFLARLVFTAITDRVYADAGHVLDFANKAFEVLDAIGWQHAERLIPTLSATIARHRGEEDAAAWRHPIDLIQLLREREARLPGAFAAGSGRSWSSEAALAELLLGDDPQAILAAIEDAAAGGALPAQLGKALAYAAAVRVARFSRSNEIGDWATVLHTFSYCNAIHRALVRCPDPLIARGLLHGAMSIYQDRFLNLPPEKLPALQDPLDDLPREQEILLEELLASFDSRQQGERTSRLIARHVRLSHPLAGLIDALARAAMREDGVFHEFQAVEAAARQCREWSGDAAHIETLMIAAGCYLAAHSPTRRTQLQTARIAQRLHRHERLDEEAAETQAQGSAAAK